MALNCNAFKESMFKERPEDILWYRLYRNEKLIIFKKKGENIEKALDVPGKPVCLQYCDFFYKVGKFPIVILKKQKLEMIIII